MSKPAQGEVVELLRGDDAAPGNGVATNPWAIGFVRWDISGSLVERDERAIRHCAGRLDYELVPMTVGPKGDPVARLLGAVGRCGAAAVIVPSREHIWTARRAVTEICTLVVVSGDQIWERGYQWPRWFAR